MTELDGVTQYTRRGRPAALTGGVLLAIGVIVAALNLRPAITSVGTMLDEARVALGASATWAGVLTTLPGLCFAAAGLAAPWLARRIGTGYAVALALGVLGIGLAVRVLNGAFVVLGGTLIATAGIAIGNVLIPVVVKDSFPARVGMMTGCYTAALQFGGALGSAATPGLASALGGWRQGLASWSMLAVLALIIWMAAVRRGHHGGPDQTPEATGGRSLLRNRLAWIVTLFFGLQSLLAYVMMGWLPQVLMDAGVSRANAGLLLGVMSLIAVPVSLTVPPLAARHGSQSASIVGLGVFGLAGMLGVLVAPSAAPLLWTILIGLGMSVFSLALTTIALRAANAQDTARLSGMAQGFGYLLAAAGPFLFGFLHDLTEGWTVPFVMLIAVLLAQMTFGALAGRPRYV